MENKTMQDFKDEQLDTTYSEIDRMQATIQMLENQLEMADMMGEDDEARAFEDVIRILNEKYHQLCQEAQTLDWELRHGIWADHPYDSIEDEDEEDLD